MRIPLQKGPDEYARYIDRLKDEIDERKRVEAALRSALEETTKRDSEITALLEGARVILEYRDFHNAARRIFDSCKAIIGARAGYVALLSEDGHENKVLFLDAGGMPCSVDPSLPMPIRGLRAEAYNNLKTVYENDFQGSPWVKFMPPGHVRLENVLFAPLLIEGRAAGIMGLANKPGGFTESDARIASAFGEFAAISLSNNWTLENLERSEERYHKVIETAKDAIVSMDRSGTIMAWNNGAERVFGYASGEMIGKSIVAILPDWFRPGSADPSWYFGRVVEALAFGKDASAFPVEMSCTSWRSREGVFYTAIIRDVTERRKAEEEIRKLNAELITHTKELEAANDNLESFSYSISHDIRTPLKTIGSYSRSLFKAYGSVLDEDGRALLARIGENVEKMDRLTGSLLTFSRMGRKSLEPCEVDMKVFAEEVFGEIMVANPEREVGLRLGDVPRAWADPAMTRVVLTNLFLNAVKFTRKKENATVEFGSLEKGAEPGFNTYFIRDNGAGFDLAGAGKLFGVFQRFHKESEFEGSGVGLATVKSVVTRHGGRVWAESRPGEGATFYFMLPCACVKEGQACA